MIHDTVENLSIYFKKKLYFHLIKALSGISESCPDGMYNIVNEDIFYKVLRYKTKDSDWIIESHQKYIDIQFLISGIEIIRIYNRCSLILKDAYNAETDNIFYETGVNTPVSEVRLIPGYFCVFFPDDVHQTQIASHNGSELITKIVFKVHEKFFTR